MLRASVSWSGAPELPSVIVTAGASKGRRSPAWRTSMPRRSRPARRFWLTEVRCWSVSNKVRLESAMPSVAPSTMTMTIMATSTSIRVNPLAQAREDGLELIDDLSGVADLDDDVPHVGAAVLVPLAEMGHDLVLLVADRDDL